VADQNSASWNRLTHRRAVSALAVTEGYQIV
jgi:hypothetical protein